MSTKLRSDSVFPNGFLRKPRAEVVSNSRKLAGNRPRATFQASYRSCREIAGTGSPPYGKAGVKHGKLNAADFLRPILAFFVEI